VETLAYPIVVIASPPFVSFGSRPWETSVSYSEVRLNKTQKPSHVGDSRGCTHARHGFEGSRSGTPTRTRFISAPQRFRGRLWSSIRCSPFASLFSFSCFGWWSPADLGSRNQAWRNALNHRTRHPCAPHADSIPEPRVAQWERRGVAVIGRALRLLRLFKIPAGR
jgi:hypothetical protein